MGISHIFQPGQPGPARPGRPGRAGRVGAVARHPSEGVYSAPAPLSAAGPPRFSIPCFDIEIEKRPLADSPSFFDLGGGYLTAARYQHLCQAVAPKAPQLGYREAVPKAPRLAPKAPPSAPKALKCPQNTRKCAVRAQCVHVWHCNLDWAPL
eukprot:gene17387-biopygen9856